MLIRIVRMTFKEEATESFLSLFDRSSSNIRSMPGCRHLELWQDAESPNVFTTYSWWETDADLQSYRESTLFRSTWEEAKTLFAAPPKAQSYARVRQVERT